MTPAFLFAVLALGAGAAPCGASCRPTGSCRLPGRPAGRRRGAFPAARNGSPCRRRFSTPMQEIWALQSRFTQTRGKRPLEAAGSPEVSRRLRFHAAARRLRARRTRSWRPGGPTFQEGNADAPPPTEPGSAGVVRAVAVGAGDASRRLREKDERGRCARLRRTGQQPGTARTAGAHCTARAWPSCPHTRLIRHSPPVSLGPAGSSRINRITSMPSRCFRPSLDAHALLDELQAIEQRHGRACA